MRRRQPIVVLVVLALAVLAALRGFDAEPLPEDFDFAEDRPRRVVHVVDGDTFRIEGGWRVRLIGVDAPELRPKSGPPEPWATEATEFLRERVGGREVDLIFDRERRDRYGRLLAFVEVDGESVNVALVEAGLAEVMPRFSYSAAMKRRLVEAERLARENGRGQWAPEAETAR